MADAEQQQLELLYKNGLFTVPKYQRGYSWTTSEVRDLLSDVEYLYRDREMQSRYDGFHYFGTIVLQDTGTKTVARRRLQQYNVIDGQQRLTSIAILIQCINEQLGEYEGEEVLGEPVEDIIEDNRETFIQFRGEARIRPQEKTKEVYDLIIVNGEDTDSVSASIPSQYYLLNAKETIHEWLAEQESANDDFLEFLAGLSEVLYSNIQVTTYTIEQTSEAGRFFEVLNDRGRDLTTIDKIKSYLIFCADRLNDERLAEDIYQKIGAVIEKVSQEGGEESVDRFIREHWRLFSGEYSFETSNITDMHRRVKRISAHVPQSRPPDEQTRWIEAYMQDMRTAAEEFRKITNPEIILRESSNPTSIERDIVSELKSFNAIGKQTNYLSLLMSAGRTFGHSREFLHTIQLCRTHAFRLYQISNARADKRRAHVRKMAYPVSWVGRSETANDIFGPGHRPPHEVFDNEEDAYNYVVEEIENDLGQYTPDYLIADYLRQSDVINGNDRWGGIGENSIIYLLYEYERYLRMQSSGESPIADFRDFTGIGKGSRRVQLEHIWPQNPRKLSEERVEEHEESVNSLGNLALISPDDNPHASNKPYPRKWQETYSDSNLQHLRELPDPNEVKWGQEAIETRTEELIEIVLTWWPGVSEASVGIEGYHNYGDEYQQELKNRISQSVRDDYRQTNGKSIPSIRIRNQVLNSDDWVTVKECDCGSLLMRVETDSGEVQCAKCNTELNSPLYQVQSKV
jgi:hypothetical protein